MVPGDRDTADGPPAGGAWTTASAVLLLLSAISQIVYGAAAIGGNATLEEHVRTIESNPNFGDLYLSLGAWGAILALVGLGELAAAVALMRRRRHARLLGLCLAVFGLGAAFFTLAIFHLASIVSVVLLLAALYALSYRVA